MTVTPILACRSQRDLWADSTAVAFDSLAWTQVDVLAVRPVRDGLLEGPAVCLACAPLCAEGCGDFAESFDADGLAVGPAPPGLEGVDPPLDSTNPVRARYRIGVAVT